MEAAPPKLTSNEDAPISSRLVLDAYPNPFADQIEMTLPSSVSGDAKAVIVDINGRNVVTELFNGLSAGARVTMDVRSLAAGSYILTLESDNQHYSAKLVKN